MSQGKQRLVLLISGLVLAATSVAGTSFVLAAHHSDSRVELAPTTIIPSIPAGGTVTCFGHADVEEGVAFLCPLQPGRVTEIYVHEDDEVTAGTTLLKLDTRQAELLVRQARANLDAARAQLARAEKRIDQQKVREAEQLAVIDATQHRQQAARWLLARKRELASLATSDKEIAATEEQCAELEAAVRGAEAKLKELRLNDPVLDIRSAEAGVAAKQARLEQALLNLDECQLKAPVDGKVLRLLISRGELLGPQTTRPAVVFCPNTPRIVRAEVEQEFAGGLMAGDEVLIRDDSRAGPSWRGRVRRLSDWYSHRRSIWQEPLQHNDVRTLECLIDVEPGQPPMRIGQRLLVQKMPAGQ
jgi:multidrug resistance efflux pump